jgi:uncharacterized membrane protein YkvA (DUF1232 family)
MRSRVDELRARAKTIRRDVHVLCLAVRDRRVPWFAKLAAFAVAAYALSPIDLIPDFIPIVGHLDDLLIVPLGILLAVKLIPANLLAELRQTAVDKAGERLLGRWGTAVVLALWLASLALIVLWLRT